MHVFKKKKKKKGLIGLSGAKGHRGEQGVFSILITICHLMGIIIFSSLLISGLRGETGMIGPIGRPGETGPMVNKYLQFSVPCINHICKFKKENALLQKFN